ncbi:hypothetical protein AB4Z52_29365 [Rhizobium sp. 2YAF20]|uniref:hypothetical protein n=1 Tax=Rhizobium sp. 2YAF20 TaxID=3233027 RepID=UPI003F9E54E8
MQLGDALEKDLEFARTNAISFGISNGKKLHYFEHWHTLRIILDDYDLIRAVGGYEQDFGKNIFADFPGDGWRERTKEGFEEYNKLRLAQIRPAPNRTAYGITGLGQIERDRIVGAYVRDPARPPPDRDDTSYEKSFRDVIVTVTGVTDEDDNAGSIFLFTEDSGDIRPGEDNLHLTLYLPSERLKDLIAEIRSSRTRPQLHVAAIVALYQSEVEASLRDWHHPQTFLLPQPHSNAPARLMQIRFGFDKAQ